MVSYMQNAAKAVLDIPMASASLSSSVGIGWVAVEAPPSNSSFAFFSPGFLSNSLIIYLGKISSVSSFLCGLHSGIYTS